MLWLSKLYRFIRVTRDVDWPTFKPQCLCWSQTQAARLHYSKEARSPPFAQAREAGQQLTCWRAKTARLSRCLARVSRAALNLKPPARCETSKQFSYSTSRQIKPEHSLKKCPGATS